MPVASFSIWPRHCNQILYIELQPWSDSSHSFFSALAVVPAVYCFTTYANDFVDPKYVLAKSFSTSTAAAQQSIVEWADMHAAEGPWSTYFSFGAAM